tara:strand:+ start:914 stop:1519 length:606 start_codon:yes stop_codon:yes gene_type:complete
MTSHLNDHVISGTYADIVDQAAKAIAETCVKQVIRKSLDLKDETEEEIENFFVVKAQFSPTVDTNLHYMRVGQIGDREKILEELQRGELTAAKRCREVQVELEEAKKQVKDFDRQLWETSEYIAFLVNKLQAITALCRKKTKDLRQSGVARCDHCQVPAGERNGAPLLSCPCKTVMYCSSKCQKLAWKAGHKKVCDWEKTE